MWRSVGRYEEVWSNPEKSGAKWKSLEQHGKVRSKSGATWRSVGRYGKVWRCSEQVWRKDMCFYFDYKLEFCPEATKLLYKTSEIPE